MRLCLADSVWVGRPVDPVALRGQRYPHHPDRIVRAGPHGRLALYFLFLEMICRIVGVCGIVIDPGHLDGAARRRLLGAADRGRQERQQPVIGAEDLNRTVLLVDDDPGGGLLGWRARPGASAMFVQRLRDNGWIVAS